MMTRTRFNKALKKTVCLRNLANVFYRQQGYVMSNNHNATYGGEKESAGKFRGAYVAPPELNAPMGMTINGSQSKFMFENVIDMDLSSLYPSIILALNIDVSTQYGKLFIEEENDDGEVEDIAYKLFDSLVSQDWINIGVQWFDLPTPEEAIAYIEGRISA